MAVSTLLVGLNELSLTQFSEVVTARGIDRVIVVASSADFNNSSVLNNLSNTKVTALKSSGVDFKLATDNGNKLSITPANYTTLSNSGFQFLTPDEFKSLSSSTAIVSGNLIQGATSNTVFPLFDPSASNTVGNYTTAVAASGIAGFGSAQAAEASTGSFSGLNDLNGTLKLNISASDFISVLSGTTPLNVRDKNNIVADQGTTPALLQPNESVHHIYKGDFPVFDGTNRIPNLTAGRDTLSHDKFILKEVADDITLTAKQVLGLPLEGMYIYPKEVILEDSSANISALLPQLTTGQYQSIHKIVLNDTSPSSLELSAGTFLKLNTFGVGKDRNSQNVYGLTSITNKTDGQPAKIRVEGSGEDLYNAFHELAVPGNTNFITQVSDVDIQLLSGDDYTRNYIIKNSVNTDTDISVYATDITLSATQFKNLLLEDAKNYSDLTIKNLRINDTQNEIQSLFSSTDTKLIAGLRQVSSFTSTTDNTVIKLDWNNLSQIAGTTSIGQFIKKVGVDSLVVSGTAGELQQIFSQFGVDFTDLPVGVEFKITDGGEIKLSTSEFEKLDGRITGAVS